MTEALITPKVLTWARKRSGLDSGQLAHRLNVRPEAIEAWEGSERRPTFRQAQNLARTLHVPFGYLFLSEPPVQNLPIPDRRTLASQKSQVPSPELLDVLNDMLSKQQWYREHREAEVVISEPSQVGRFGVADSAEAVAEHIRDAIRLEEARNQAHNWDDFLSGLSRGLENSGVMVMRSGIVGNNTHRPLSVEEFRGFVLNDDVAPLVFLNARDSACAQTFTLAYESALVWVGESGVSDADYRSALEDQDDYVAQFCNQVAAEILSPPLSNSHGDSESFFTMPMSDHEDDTVAPAYVVHMGHLIAPSSDLKLALYNEESGEEYSRSQSDASVSYRPEDTFYRLLIGRNGTLLTNAVISCLSEGTLLHKEAADLLNVKPKTLPRIAEYVSGH